MAEDARTYAALLALLADNTSANASTRDVRDFMRSVMGGYGCISMAAPAAPQVLTADTPVAVVGWDTSFSGLDTTADEALSKVTIDITAHYLLLGIASYSLGSAGLLDWHFAVNDTPVGPHISRAVANNALDVVPVLHLTPCNAGDELKLYVEAEDTGETLTMNGGALIVLRVGG